MEFYLPSSVQYVQICGNSAIRLTQTSRNICEHRCFGVRYRNGRSWVMAVLSGARVEFVECQVRLGFSSAGKQSVCSQ